MKLENGDQFEKENADWIRQNLPSYETLWKDFIGNDGTAHPLELRNLSAEGIPARRRFYQAHYSMAQSAKRIGDLLETIEGIILESKAEHSYDAQFDLLFNLLSRIGHVRDMVGKMDAALGMAGSAVNKLQVFYDLRSHVTHGPQVPFYVKSDIIHIPRIGGRNPEAAEWDDGKSWDEMKPESFVPLSTFCEVTVQDFFVLLVSIHEKIYSAAKEKYKGCELELAAQLPRSSSDGLRFGNESLSTTPSLSAYNISGSYWA